MSILSVNNLSAAYGKIRALHEISLEVNEGELVSVIGANGAGKTTTLASISGIIRPTGGTVLFRGEPVHHLPASELVKRGMAHVPEGRKIFSRLSVLDNLSLGAFTRNSRAEIQSDVKHVFTLFPILEERKGQLGGTLSGGEQQMLAIGRALMSRPKLLLMDEPSMGVAPLLVAKIFEIIRQLNRDGISILLVEQAAKRALSLANRGYILENCTISASAPASALLDDPKVRAAYLGA